MLAALVAWELLILSAYAFRPGSDGLTTAVVLMILGGGMLGVALRAAGHNRALAEKLPMLTQWQLTKWRSRLAMGVTLVGIGLLWAVSENNGGTFQTGWYLQMSYNFQAALLFLGTLLVTWGMSGLAWRDGEAAARAASQPMRVRWELWALVGILLLAFGLRFWQLDQQPRFLVDELNTIGYIRDLWDNNQVALLHPMTNVSPFPWTFAYGQFMSVTILGRNLMGLRGASAVTGTLTVAAVYLLAATLFDRKTGLVAALLLATFPPHLHFSRLALLNIADPLIGTLLLAFVARGLRHFRRLDFAIAGLFLGLTQYFYEGGRLFYPALLVGWLLLGILTQRERLRRGWRGLASMVVTAVIISVPVYYTWAAIGAPLTGRMEASGLSQDDLTQILLSPSNSEAIQKQEDRLSEAFLFYVHEPDRVLFYGGETALILTPLIPAFLMGIGYCLWQRRWRTLLLVWWVVGTGLANGIFLIIPAASSRYMVVVPALVILMAVGLRYGLPLVWAASGNWAALRRRTLSVCAIVCVGMIGILAGIQAVYYFGEHLPYYSTQFRYDHHYRDLDDVVFRSLKFPANTEIHVVSTYDEQDWNYVSYLLKFMTDSVTADTLLYTDFTAAYLDNLPRNVDHAFFIDPDDTEALTLIRQHFDKIDAPQYSPYPDVPLGKQYVLYFAPTSGQASHDAGKPDE